MQENEPILYNVWGVDNVAYGPIELPALINWVQDQRVIGQSWVFGQDKSQWCQAKDLPELKMFFRDKRAPEVPGTTITRRAGPDVQPAMLRRIKMFAEMDDLQIMSFAKYLDMVRVRQFDVVVRVGDPGDAMYLILDGELRSRAIHQGRETTLNTMGSGEFFGEMALLDHGPRSADVVANKDSTLLKISAAAFDRIIKEAAALAAPFLYALSRTEVARMRQLIHKYEASINFARTAGVTPGTPAQH